MSQHTTWYNLFHISSNRSTSNSMCRALSLGRLVYSDGILSRYGIVRASEGDWLMRALHLLGGPSIYIN